MTMMHGLLPAAHFPLKAFIVDMDGVVTSTHKKHAYAWKLVFDDFLAKVSERDGRPFVPFDPVADFAGLVDGLPRYEGACSFLGSRGIVIPYGDPDDWIDQETACGLGNRKNALFNELVRTHGAEVFQTTVALLRAFRARGVRTAVVSSSKNCRMLLDRCGLHDLFEAIIDGQYAADHHLPGKPAPDTYLRAASLLGVAPDRAAMVEDAIAGVQSGRAGGFGLVIGIDRGAGWEALLAGGADVVVDDLAELNGLVPVNGMAV